MWNPSCALYWHIGATQMRFGISTSRILRGVNSLGTALPDGCGITALPATGSCSGEKNGTPLAATFGMEGKALEAFPLTDVFECELGMSLFRYDTRCVW